MLFSKHGSIKNHFIIISFNSFSLLESCRWMFSSQGQSRSKQHGDPYLSICSWFWSGRKPRQMAIKIEIRQDVKDNHLSTHSSNSLASMFSHNPAIKVIWWNILRNHTRLTGWQVGLSQFDALKLTSNQIHFQHNCSIAEWVQRGNNWSCTTEVYKNKFAQQLIFYKALRPNVF